MTNQIQPILLDDSDVIAALKLDQDDLEFLCASRQIIPITLRGKRRFLTTDVQALVRIYQTVQHRNQA